MNPLGDADAVDALAGRCDRSAEWLEDIGRRWAARLERAQWQCAKADRQREIARSRARDARRHAEDLRHLARDLRGHARWIRDRTRQLDGFERRIRDWFDRNTPDIDSGPAPWESWGIRPSFPGRGEPGWQDMFDKLRRYGADL